MSVYSVKLDFCCKLWLLFLFQTTRGTLKIQSQQGSPFQRYFNWLERFSSDCQKTNAKVITSTNHNRSKQRDEPILTVPSNYLYLAQSVGKIAPTRYNWPSQSSNRNRNRNRIITFDSYLKTALLWSSGLNCFCFFFLVIFVIICLGYYLFFHLCLHNSRYWGR